MARKGKMSPYVPSRTRTHTASICTCRHPSSHNSRHLRLMRTAFHTSYCHAPSLVSEQHFDKQKNRCPIHGCVPRLFWGSHEVRAKEVKNVIGRPFDPAFVSAIWSLILTPLTVSLGFCLLCVSVVRPFGFWPECVSWVCFLRCVIKVCLPVVFSEFGTLDHVS